MSTRMPVLATCVGCGAELTITVFDSISTDRLPQARGWVIDRTLASATCACGQVTRVEAPTLFADMTRGWWIDLAIESDRSAFEDGERRTRERFAIAFDTSRFPPAIAAIRDRLRLRIVFGLEELREKVLCSEHGIDDVFLEILKLELLVARPELLEHGIERLLLDRVTDDGALDFIGVARTEDGARLERAADLRVARSAHDAMAARRGTLESTYPALFRACYVNALRYTTS